MVKYDNFLSNFRLKYPELDTMTVRYCMCNRFENISFTVGAFCIDLIGARFNFAGSKH